MLLTSRLGREYYREVIRSLTEDLYLQHLHYLSEKEECKCDEDEESDLLKFLQRSGVYQTYLTSMTRAASLLVNDVFNYTGDTSVMSREYQVYIVKNKSKAKHSHFYFLVEFRFGSLRLYGKRNELRDK